MVLISIDESSRYVGPSTASLVEVTDTYVTFFRWRNPISTMVERRRIPSLFIDERQECEIEIQRRRAVVSHNIVCAERTTRSSPKATESRIFSRRRRISLLVASSMTCLLLMHEKVQALLQQRSSLATIQSSSHHRSIPVLLMTGDKGEDRPGATVTLLEEKREPGHNHKQHSNTSSSNIGGFFRFPRRFNGATAPKKDSISPTIPAVEPDVVLHSEPRNKGRKPKALSSNKHSVKKPSVTVSTSNIEDVAAAAAADLSDLLAEVNDRITDGTAQLFGNLTAETEEKFVQAMSVAEEYVTDIDDFAAYFADVTVKIQDAQKRELDRQLTLLQKKFISPLDDVAFSDVPLLAANTATRTAPDQKRVPLDPIPTEDSADLVLMGANSTLVRSSKELRTSDLIRNIHVAPFYYSIALCIRWIRRASTSSVFVLSLFKNLASIFKSNTKPSRKEQRIERKVQREQDALADVPTQQKKMIFRRASGEALQAGWKRTGEIASKGAWGRRWAIFRRSAEIWAYFSSFYLRDRRISSRYLAGKYTEEQYTTERRKLGAEITQNLLKLGPTVGPM
jgi:hypothetical protein